MRTISLPTIVVFPKMGALVLALMGLPAVALLAAFSWHLTEKPILGLQEKLSFVAQARGFDGHSGPMVTNIRRNWLPGSLCNLRTKPDLCTVREY
ncbi:hypothetical protein [Bradyrhizobium sp. CSS354]|uniref:hypothetical protein n=1 Tax=Bradyrhizobium sp. CSS354 TaxID=2699172 RepID=UPI0023AF5B31|nr:hypothetical protein [Bradyrhizobium sp. CSS354]MDE5463901.1 hypothetical protein [Bradyrhizobium sp. CSS354]